MSDGDLALPLGRSRRKGLWPEPIVGRERQEARVVNRASTLSPNHDRFLFVVETNPRDALQMIERAYVAADQVVKVFTVHHLDPLSPRVTEDVRERMNLPKGQLVGRPILLTLSSRTRFESFGRGDHRSRHDRAQVVFHDRGAALITLPLDELENSLWTRIRELRQDQLDLLLERIQDRGSRRWRFRKNGVPLRDPDPVLPDNFPDEIPGALQPACNLPQ